MPFAPLQSVVLARDIPEEGLSAGASVVILDVHDGGQAYEVEVFDENGHTLFVGALPGDTLLGEEVAPPATPRGDFNAERPALLRHIEEASHPHERSQARADYIRLLPTHQLSRCPISGDVLERAMDAVELDGPWWDYYQPARPPSPPFPTLVSLTGAVRLHHVPYTSFLAVPGPERPFVIPGLLDVDGVVAVISWLPIGAHQGYPIAYFAPPPGPPLQIGRPNDWGAWSHLVQGPEQIEERQDHPYEAEWDYDLSPWIERGKLLWIRPGDRSLTLRSTVDECPYLNLGGHRGITRLKRGEAWWPEDIS